MERPAKPRLFVDADVLIAASASTKGASHVLLQLSDLTIIECVVSEQVIVEAERNLKDKLPQALPAFRLLVASAVEQVEDPDQSQTQPLVGQAEAKDLSILAAALSNGCQYLVTFNVRHYRPLADTITVLRPGEFLLKLREQLSRLVS